MAEQEYPIKIIELIERRVEEYRKNLQKVDGASQIQKESIDGAYKSVLNLTNKIKIELFKLAIEENNNGKRN